MENDLAPSPAEIAAAAKIAAATRLHLYELILGSYHPDDVFAQSQAFRDACRARLEAINSEALVAETQNLTTQTAALAAATEGVQAATQAAAQHESKLVEVTRSLGQIVAEASSSSTRLNRLSLVGGFVLALAAIVTVWFQYSQQWRETHDVLASGLDLEYYDGKLLALVLLPNHGTRTETVIGTKFMYSLTNARHAFGFGHPPNRINTDLRGDPIILDPGRAALAKAETTLSPRDFASYLPEPAGQAEFQVYVAVDSSLSTGLGLDSMLHLGSLVIDRSSIQVRSTDYRRIQLAPGSLPPEMWPDRPQPRAGTARCCPVPH